MNRRSLSPLVRVKLIMELAYLCGVGDFAKQVGGLNDCKN